MAKYKPTNPSQGHFLPVFFHKQLQKGTFEYAINHLIDEELDLSLLLDAGEHGPKWIVGKVAEALGTTPRSLEHLKKRFVEEGLPASIERKERVKPPREIQFGGEFEAQLLTLACSKAPEGRKRWTVRLLAEKMIELKIVPTVSPMTVCNILKKMNLNLI